MSSSEVPVTVVSASGKRITIEVSLDVTLEDTLVVAEAMMVEPLGGRRVQLPGRARPLQPGETLRAQGVTGGATLYVDQARPTSAQPAPRQPPASVDDQIRNLFGGAPRVTPPGTPPPSADVSRTIEALFASGAQQRQPVLDPDDPEVQRRAYEAIQQRQVEENLAQAMEETPEAFGSVVMLYVQSAVNNVPVAAFIDSGAQMTVMSARVAEQCNLTRLIDRRFKGIAKGVGTTNIIGRIHMAQVRIGPLDDKVNCIFLPMSITVVEQDGMDFLIGLDQLRRHRMCIDLEKNCLRIGDLGKEYTFLAEHELPEHIRGENQPDPTSPTTSGEPTGQQRSTTHGNGSSLTPQQGAMIQALQGMFPQADRTVVQNALEASNWQLDEATTFLSASF